MKEITSENVQFVDESIWSDLHKSKTSVVAYVHHIPNKQNYTDNIVVIHDNQAPNLYANTKTKLINTFKNLEKLNLLNHVDVTGFKSAQTKNTIEKGSVRFSTKSKILADYLTNCIEQSNLKELIIKDNQYYEFVKVSQYFRVMKYTDGSTHYPHYDSDFCSTSEQDYQNLYSIVLYLTTNETGELAFIDDNASKYSKECAGNHSDWNRQAFDEEIFLKLKPDLNMVIFPHNLCHSVLPFHGKQVRLICRGDLMFKKANHHAG